MPMKGSGATALREIDRFDGGVGWIAYPEERMQRASHALVDGDDVWVIDPVDADGLDDLLADHGEVAGAVVLLDRHTRDAGAIARRHGVAVHRPAWMRGVDSEVDAPVETLGNTVGSTDYAVHKLIDTPVWREASLYHPEDGTLVVPESLGTAPYFLTGGEQFGVHPMVRFTPPRDLGDRAAERVLVGHGEGVMSDAAAAIRDTVANSRRRAPRLYAEAIRDLVA
jgi:hypothetical protein